MTLKESPMLILCLNFFTCSLLLVQLYGRFTLLKHTIRKMECCLIVQLRVKSSSILSILSLAFYFLVLWENTPISAESMFKKLSTILKKRSLLLLSVVFWDFDITTWLVGLKFSILKTGF